jgi:hypothetical protein
VQIHPFGFSILEEEALHPGTAYLVDLSKLKDMVLVTTGTVIAEEVGELKTDGVLTLRYKWLFEMWDREEFLAASEFASARPVHPIVLGDEHQ